MIFRGTEGPPQRKIRKPFADRPIATVLSTFLCFFVLSGVTLGTVQYVKTCPQFRVQTIRVEGANVLSDTEIIEHSAITYANSVFFLDTEGARRRILGLPLIKTCKIITEFPNKVIITVEERKALATLMINNRLFEIDEDGNVLRELGKGIEHIGPFITNVKGLASVEVGQHITVPALSNAMATWSAFRKTAIAREITVSEISAAYENRIAMYCDELRFEIRWGRDNLDRQAAKLDYFWKIQNKRIEAQEYIDLRFGNDIACK